MTEQDGRLTAELKDLDDSSMDGRFAFTNTYNGFYQPNGERLVVLQGGVRQADGSLEQLYLESCRVSTNQPYDSWPPWKRSIAPDTLKRKCLAP